MSKLFFDHLLDLEKLEKTIKKISTAKVEQEEFFMIVEEIVNHRVMSIILTRLPEKHHNEFLAIFHKCPHDQIAIFGYLNEKIGTDMEKELKTELVHISTEILKELMPDREISSEGKVSKK